MSLLPIRGSIQNPAQANVDFNGNALVGVSGLQISGSGSAGALEITYPGNTGATASFSYGLGDQFNMNKKLNMTEKDIENATNIKANTLVQAGVYFGGTGGVQGSMVIGGTAGNGDVYDTLYNKVPTQSYASFSSSADQAIGSTAASQIITYNTTDVASADITRGATGNEGRITCAKAGVYKVLTSIQFAKASSNAATAYVWFAVNGTNVANSSSSITLAGNAANALATVEVILTLTANQYIEVLMAGDSTDISAEHLAAETTPYARPANPSIITTVVRLSP